MRAVVLVLLLIFIINEDTLAQAGYLDQTFGNSGIVTTNYSNVSEDIGRAVAVQPDGKIVLVGHTGYDTSGVMVCRYLNDGSLDPSFGNNGKAIINPEWGTANAVALQSDGKIIFAGASKFGGDKFLVSRLNDDGTIDSSFGSDGSILIWPAYGKYDDEAMAVIIQPAEPTDKIVVVGTSEDESYPYESVITILRFNINGTLDSTFNNTGILNYGPPWQGSMFGFTAGLQPNNKIVVGGWNIDTYQQPMYREVIIRLTDNGTLDSTFNDDGVLMDDSLSWCRSLLVQSNGKIIAIGASPNTRFAMARYNTDGSPDSSFGINGKVTGIEMDQSDLGYSGVLFPDGKIITTGTYMADPTNGIELFSTSCYNSDGTIDSSFGEDGKVRSSIYNTSYAYSIALQPDGKIVVGGTTESKSEDSMSVVLVRYLTELNTGVINYNQGVTTDYIYPNPIKDGAINFQYELPELSNITISLLDLTGNKVQGFINHEIRYAGKQSEVLQLDPTLSAGLYFLELQTSHGSVSIKITKQ